MKPVKLSVAQYKMLSNVAAGRPWDSHLVGRSAHGGARATRSVLLRLGCMKNGVITEMGRMALGGTAEPQAAINLATQSNYLKQES